MANYRKIWLTNGVNQKFDLTDLDKDGFLTDLSGLGVTSSISTTRIGNSLKANSAIYNFDQISGSLYFTNDNSNGVAYQKYTDFFNFINKYPIYLHYQTPAMLDYDFEREILVSSLSKSEVDKNYNTLVCKVDFQPLTFWFNSKETIIEVDGSQEGSKSYALNRPYHYATIGFKNIKLINNSPVSVPLIIEVVGYSVNTEYELYDENNSCYGIGKIIGNFDYVFIDSNDISEQIQLKVGDSWIPNAFNHQDFTVSESGQYLTYLYLKPGQSILKFNFDNDFDGLVRIRYSGGLYATI